MAEGIFAMKISLTLALAAVFAVPMMAQQTGVSIPPETVEDVPQVVAQPVAKSAMPVVESQAQKPSAAKEEVYGEFRPYGGTPVLKPRVVQDPDAGIVIDVPRKENELPMGTQMRVRLNKDVDTTTTQAGTPFTAQVADNVAVDGKVFIPAGAVLEGRITEVRGGRRIRGTALIHLQADGIVMPDGTRLPLRAQVIDTDQSAETKTDVEGNILRKDHPKETLAVVGLAAGGAAAAGGVLAGPAGALIGAGVGAGVSTVVWLKQDRQAHLPEGTEVVLSLTEPLDFSHANFAATSSAPMVAPSTTASVATVSAQPGEPYVQAFVPTN